MVIPNSAVSCRILRQFPGRLLQLAGHSPHIVALVMVERRRDLNEGLEEASVGVSNLMPQVLPRFVGLEELLLVEEGNTLIKPGIPSVKSIHD